MCTQAYVNGFNAALEQYAEAENKGDQARMIALQPALKFNGGGALCCAVLSHGHHASHVCLWPDVRSTTV